MLCRSIICTDWTEVLTTVKIHSTRALEFRLCLRRSVGFFQVLRGRFQMYAAMKQTFTGQECSFYKRISISTIYFSKAQLV
jgi:hypothetical protein